MTSDKKTESNNHLSVKDKLADWCTRTLGIQLMTMEHSHIDRVLPNLFGYHIVQLGDPDEKGFLETSRISHKMILHLESNVENKAKIVMICSSDALALETDSIDVIVMPHVLESAENPHRVLREVERALIGEGHVIIVGFNPWGLWGLWRIFLAWREEAPWNGHFYGLPRLKDWLSLLDFEIIKVNKFFYRPPLKKENVMQKLLFLEKLGKYCWPFFCGAYMVVAKKRIIPLTPIKMNWRDKRKIVATEIAEPSARVQDH